MQFVFSQLNEPRLHASQRQKRNFLSKLQPNLYYFLGSQSCTHPTIEAPHTPNFPSLMRCDMDDTFLGGKGEQGW